MPHSVAKVAFVVVQPIHGIQFLFETIPMVQYDDRQCCLYRQRWNAMAVNTCCFNCKWYLSKHWLFFL